jgi:hypothetical protein
VVTHTGAVSDYEGVVSELSGSIRLGYEVEQDDPNFRFEVPPEDEINWLAAWLVSEGWSRSPHWHRD